MVLVICTNFIISVASMEMEFCYLRLIGFWGQVATLSGQHNLFTNMKRALKNNGKVAQYLCFVQNSYNRCNYANIYFSTFFSYRHPPGTLKQKQSIFSFFQILVDIFQWVDIYCIVRVYLFSLYSLSVIWFQHHILWYQMTEISIY